MPHVLKERACLNADKTKVVDCESEEAAFVLGGEGTEIPGEDAVKYGLVKATKRKVDQPEPEGEGEEEGASKARPKPSAKAVAGPPENKAVSNSASENK